MKNLDARFAEVERRVKALLAENHALRGRVTELEDELERTRRSAREYENIHGKRLRIREKVERMLKDLEAVSADRGRTASSGTGERQ